MANRKPRTQKQLEALALGRAKAAEKKQANKARKAGVDTTASAGDDPDGLPPGSPDVRTTGYQPVGDSPEQTERKKKNEPAPDPLPDSLETTEAGKTGTDSGSTPDTPQKRSGLLGMIADGLGL